MLQTKISFCFSWWISFESKTIIQDDDAGRGGGGDQDGQDGDDHHHHLGTNEAWCKSRQRNRNASIASISDSIVCVVFFLFKCLQIDWEGKEIDDNDKSNNNVKYKIRLLIAL